VARQSDRLSRLLINPISIVSIVFINGVLK